MVVGPCCASRTATTTSATGWDSRHRHRRHHHPHQQFASEALSQLRHLSSSPPAYARAKTAKAKGSAASPAEEPAPPPAPFSTPPAVPAPQTRAAPLTLDERLERSQLKTLEDKPTQKYVAKVKEMPRSHPPSPRRPSFHGQPASEPSAVTSSVSVSGRGGGGGRGGAAHPVLSRLEHCARSCTPSSHTHTPPRCSARRRRRSGWLE